MKENPRNIPVVESLRAGILSRDGFMGEDTRPFTDIILDDAAALAALGTNAVELAQKMTNLTKLGQDTPGITVTHKGYAITVEEYMGKIGCPFRDHRAPKRNTTVVGPKGQEMSWTDLNVHLIRAHGFFQGQGAPYRLEPMDLADFFAGE